MTTEVFIFGGGKRVNGDAQCDLSGLGKQARHLLPLMATAREMIVVWLVVNDAKKLHHLFIALGNMAVAVKKSDRMIVKFIGLFIKPNHAGRP